MIPGGGRMRTFLIVDDSAVIRKVARRIIEGLGFRVAEAEDGRQAVEQCRAAISGVGGYCQTNPRYIPAGTNSGSRQRRN